MLEFYQNIEKTFKNIKNDKLNVFFSIYLCFWCRQSSLFVNPRAENFDFYEKSMDFWAKHDHFSNFDKWPEMIVSGCYIAQNNSKRSPKLMLEVDIVCVTYQTCQKKARGTKMTKTFS